MPASSNSALFPLGPSSHCFGCFVQNSSYKLLKAQSVCEEITQPKQKWSLVMAYHPEGQEMFCSIQTSRKHKFANKIVSKWISKFLNRIFKKFYTERKDWPTEKPRVCSEVHIWCSLRDSETSVRVIKGSSKTEALYPKAERAQDENVKTMKWWHICNTHVTYPRQSTSQDNQHHIWRHICNTYAMYPRQSISHVKTHMQHACNMPKTINIRIKDGKRLLILAKGDDGSWCSMK